MTDNEFIILEHLNELQSPINYSILENHFEGYFDSRTDESFHKAFSSLIWKGLVDEDKMVITEIGRRIYREEKAARDKNEYERKLQIRKLEVDLKNAERVYKTYRITRIFAWIGAISGIVALLLKIAELLGILHR